LEGSWLIGEIECQSGFMERGLKSKKPVLSAHPVALSDNGQDYKWGSQAVSHQGVFGGSLGCLCGPHQLQSSQGADLASLGNCGQWSWRTVTLGGAGPVCSSANSGIPGYRVPRAPLLPLPSLLCDQSKSSPPSPMHTRAWVL
jgi:hypothetical protein